MKYQIKLELNTAKESEAIPFFKHVLQRLRAGKFSIEGGKFRRNGKLIGAWLKGPL